MVLNFYKREKKCYFYCLKKINILIVVETMVSRGCHFSRLPQESCPTGKCGELGLSVLQAAGLALAAFLQLSLGLVIA